MMIHPLVAGRWNSKCPSTTRSRRPISVQCFGRESCCNRQRCRRHCQLTSLKLAEVTTTPDTPQPAEENEQPKKKERTSQGRQPRTFPEFLPREEQRNYLNPENIPEEMRDNPDVRRFFKKVGETLEMTPMQLKVVEQWQEVIALDRPDETTTMVAARRPAALIQSFAGPSLWAYLTVSRFADLCVRRKTIYSRMWRDWTTAANVGCCCRIKSIRAARTDSIATHNI